MTEEQRQQKLKEQSNAQYAAYGEFAVKFEHVCQAVHTAMVFMLLKEGLRNQQVAHVLLANLTADPLRTLFAALIAETQQLTSQEKKIIDSLLKRFQSLTEKRNDIIHGTWFIGWASTDATDFSTISGFKHHRSSKGASAKSFKYTVNDFQILTKESESLHKLFMRLHGCFSCDFSVIKNFIVDEHGFVSSPN